MRQRRLGPFTVSAIGGGMHEPVARIWRHAAGCRGGDLAAAKMRKQDAVRKYNRFARLSIPRLAGAK